MYTFSSEVTLYSSEHPSCDSSFFRSTPEVSFDVLYNEEITPHFWDWSKHGRTIYMALADATPSSVEYTKKISERSGFSNLFTEKLPEAIFYLMKTINKI
jgi:hypothetical protein